VEYRVHAVDVSIRLPEEIRFPAAILELPCKAGELFNDNQQRSLDMQTEKYGQIAQRAFDLWLRTIRWKCNNGAIGRPELHGSETGWATHLVDESTKKDIWASPQMYVVRRQERVTEVCWNDTGRALTGGLEPPVYYDLMFDGEEHLRIGDFKRSAVDCAVACEAFLRIWVGQHLPVDLSDAVRQYVNDANIRQVLKRFFPEILDGKQAKLLQQLRSDLQRLFDARNTILHSGCMENLTPDDCQTFLIATQRLISMETHVIGHNPVPSHME
jgi:hypothetical protein